MAPTRTGTSWTSPASTQRTDQAHPAPPDPERRRASRPSSPRRVFTPKFTAANFTPKFTAASFAPSSPRRSFTPKFTAASFTPKFTAANFTPKFTAASFTPKFTAASFTPKFTAASFASKFTAFPLTASVARSITSDFLGVGVRYSAEDGVAAAARRAALVDIGELHRLVGAARVAQPDAVATDLIIRSVATKALSAAPPPIADNGLLVEDPATVTSWVSALVSRARSPPVG